MNAYALPGVERDGATPKWGQLVQCAQHLSNERL